ncbi:MAG: PHP domain-containing protein [Candidatus Omnitrophica bacterium]|nr:PHP domain-containing protein [Candidatus Omnitrophota bacterium]
MRYADLHTHTLFSDGTYTPQGLVEEALKQGLDAVSITDHDNVCGIAPALEAAKHSGPEVIPGIELSAEYNCREVHILGYFIDYGSQRLAKELAVLKNNRISRIHKIVEKLDASGIKLEAQSIFDIAASGTPGRMHVALAMVKQGAAGSVYEAFEKYIGDKGPAYVCGFRFSPLEAIRLIRECGGVAVLAHPYLIDDDELIPQLVKSGLQGLEVYYPEHTQSMVNFYLSLARQHNLAVTGGSDFHGKLKPQVKIGSIKIPYELVEELRKLKA